MHMLRTTVAAALTVLVPLAGPGIGRAAALAQVELIPREVLFGNPERTRVTISPDGTRIAFLAAREGVMNVWVQTIGQDDARPVTAATGRPIRRYFWAKNGRQVIYAQDRGGDENHHLYAVDLDTGDEFDLTPIDGVQARVTAIDREFPEEILVALNDRVPQHHDVWKINTRTGERELVFENSEGYAQLIADSQFQIRLATRITRSGAMRAFTRDTVDEDWYELVRFTVEDTAASGCLGFSRDGRAIYLTDSRDSDTSRLFRYALDGEDGPEYEAMTPGERSDVEDVVMDPLTGRPQAVAFNYERQSWTVLDPALQADWDHLASVADGEMSVSSRDDADQRWIVSYLRDDGPVGYYLYDRVAGEASYLFSDRPALEHLALAEMQPVVIDARDGLPLVSYVTLPPGKTPQNLPMVLLVHGGPWARDTWGYHPIHQWLSNRGYAVLSVNFRGSSGFGKTFLNAGNGEWAGRMHDDLIDAVNWAVDEGIAHPDRVAIMGGSYGGYATLVGLTMTPEFFAAGVDIVGPSHVRTLLESIPPYWEPVRAMFDARVGRTDEPAFLDRISPLTHVNAIRRPLLIGQGRNDPRVKEQESLQIVEAMQARRIPVTYVVFPDEGHGFARPENAIAFWAVTEAFLADHLGGRFEPIGSTVRTSSAEVPAGRELIPGL